MKPISVIAPPLTVEQAIDMADPLAPEFLPTETTKCNWFTRKVAKLMGAYLPEAMANALAKWLATKDAIDAGWAPDTEQVARQWCDAGGLSVAVWANPEGVHGHIAPLTIAPQGEAGITYVANVGKRNARRMKLRVAFGARVVAFYTFHPRRVSEVPQA